MDRTNETGQREDRPGWLLGVDRLQFDLVRRRLLVDGSIAEGEVDGDGENKRPDRLRSFRKCFPKHLALGKRRLRLLLGRNALSAQINY